jgi:hypothetical protein
MNLFDRFIMIGVLFQSHRIDLKGLIDLLLT